jgi:SHAQKYF class myb-like DNA-binding protein
MLFLKGLEIYGESWKKISEIVQTRTHIQIRSHAQYHFFKLEKAKKVGLKCYAA